MYIYMCVYIIRGFLGSPLGLFVYCKMRGLTNHKQATVTVYIVINYVLAIEKINKTA